ncbi:MAG: Hsp20/alpha crystallin family protein [Candidatus Korarchaeota archaeon]|nr:Hsp20/alpha crystallin family protein [Candidatus Korarchaeota archaeon]
MGWYYREVRWAVYSVRGPVEPISDVFVERDRVKVIVDLPGTRKEDVNLLVREDAVFLEARANVGGNPVTYRKLIRLPVEVDPDGARATMRSGMLVVEAPIKRPQFRRIGVE